MWSFTLQGYIVGVWFKILLLQITGVFALVPLAKENCRNSIYCEIVDGEQIWKNGCGLERPTKEAWDRKQDILIEGFERHFNSFTDDRDAGLLQEDEETFPRWLVKRMTPKISSSEMFCDGLGKCFAPSCDEYSPHLSTEEKELAQFMFEFFSTLDHTHHAMDQAVSDFFDALSFDIEWIAKEFTYADELQDKAIEKKREQDMIFAIIAAILLTLAAVTGTASLFAGPMTAGISSGIAGAATGAMGAGMMGKVGQLATSFSKGVRVGLRETKLSFKAKDEAQYLEHWVKNIENMNTVTGSIVTSGFIGITGFVKEARNIRHGDDVEGFNKFLALFKHWVAGLVEDSHDEIQGNMATIIKGRKIAGGQDLLDLFKSGFYSDADVDLREFISSTLHRMFTARIISSLWRDEGVHIVESRTEGNTTCEQDTRGPGINRVCLPERPHHTYNIQAITHWNDEKIHRPPGLEYLVAEGGYKGLTTEDVVRSSLFQYEVWRTKYPDEEPSIETILMEAAKSPNKQKRGRMNSTVNALDDYPRYIGPASKELVSMKEVRSGYNISILEHYSQVPAAFNIPVCRSWLGQAMSGIEKNGKSNAPCFCDAPNPFLASDWKQPNNWTQGYTWQFIMEAELWRSKEYGELCHDHHDCEGERTWKQVLGLPANEEVPKEMEEAWDRCDDPGEPGGGASHTGTESPSATPSSTLDPTKTLTATYKNMVIIKVGTEPQSVIYTIPPGSPTQTAVWTTQTSQLSSSYTTTINGKAETKLWVAPIVKTQLVWSTIIYPPQPTKT